MTVAEVMRSSRLEMKVYMELLFEKLGYFEREREGGANPKTK